MDQEKIGKFIAEMSKIYFNHEELKSIKSRLDEEIQNLDSIFKKVKAGIDIEIYENEIKKINNIKGCYGSFTKTQDLNYSFNKHCDLNKMADEEIETEYGLDSYNLKLNKTEIEKNIKRNNKSMRCQLVK